MTKHAADNTYKVEGSHKRKNTYTIGIVLSAIALASLVTFGIITIPDITGFIELVGIILAALYAGYELITNIVARKNVEPPTEYEELV